MNDRNECPMRHENGNCLCMGGFCTAVSDEVCIAMRSAYLSGQNQAMRDSIAKIEEKFPRWIPVTEGLPELNQEVLVYAVGKIDGFIGESTMALTDRMLFRLFPSSPGTETWSSPWQYFLTDYEITHWMPLPPRPEGSV